jgi:hypothetical protein
MLAGSVGQSGMRRYGFGSVEGLGTGGRIPAILGIPGSPGAPVGFLMYPQAETTEGRRLDSLDPDRFKYEIMAREIM